MLETRGKRILESEFKYVLENLDNDSYLNAKHKHKIEIFRTFLETNSFSSENEFVDRINRNFFWQADYQQLGENLLLKHDEVLGHTVEKQRFSFEFYDSLLDTKNDKEYERILSRYDLTKIQSIFDQLDIGRIISEFGETKLRKYQMWSFVNSNYNKSIIDGYKHEELSSLLALNENTLPKYLFGHIIPPEINAFRPTIFDAGFGQNWKPGGYTIPNGTCVGRKGLEELVHSPNTSKNITEILILSN